ncbi:hypothetical protein GUJ93_ZPchr0008g13865 [Zizania palustris]|uniref:BRI1 kinase inhibitor 1 n=1 Tax=Zizania palustris TaxID=103762 RepID=A0A8J5RKI8_ZIZPA|nr:hypothetical protein GUJ93_ZPchr0008g13865 [Zizania palustris]
MSQPVRRVGSDLSRSICSAANRHGALQHQSTSSNDVHGSNDDVAKAKQRLRLLFSGISTWRRSVDGGGAGRSENGDGGKKRQVNASSRRGGALDLAQLVKKYVSMLEQLFASFSNGRSREKRGRRELRRRPHSFTSGRGVGGGGAGTLKRQKGSRLSSAPASLRWSPVNSGHLSVGGSAVKVSTSSSSESTMEELHSAIQAAIAHCKNSIAVAKQ